MVVLIETLKARQGVLSCDDLARIIGIKTPSLQKYLKGERNLGVANIRKIATWARSNQDNEMVQALIDYALGPQ